MINSLKVGCGQRVVWVGAHAARAAFGLADFLRLRFSPASGDGAAAIFILRGGEKKICQVSGVNL
jgi:hypothetical protein